MMSRIFFQITGGLFYLLNKLFFAVVERSEDPCNQQKWRVCAWIVYLLGVPPWVLVFISEHSWIAAAIETSGVPAILMGLMSVRQGSRHIRLSKWLDLLTRIMIVAGLGLSLYDFGGLTTLNQVMELGIALGFLFGTYLLAKSKPSGYLWLLFGNASAACLMMWQGYYVLMSQQILSMIPVTDAYRTYKRRH
jgi:hypothetical protein